ncbi:hypothetical protein ACOSP7_000668 [Xanthoceras sorbifolium]
MKRVISYSLSFVQNSFFCFEGFIFKIFLLGRGWHLCINFFCNCSHSSAITLYIYQLVNITQTQEDRLGIHLDVGGSGSGWPPLYFYFKEIGIVSGELIIESFM